MVPVLSLAAVAAVTLSACEGGNGGGNAGAAARPVGGTVTTPTTGAPLPSDPPSGPSQQSTAHAGRPAIPSQRTPSSQTPSSQTPSTGPAAAPGTPGTQPAPQSPTATGTPGTAGPTGTPDPTQSVPPAQVPVSLVSTTAAGGRTVALTFDDGPSAQWTPQILALLQQYGVKAVFCEIGPNATANPAMVKRVVAAGHRLCDHTVTHDENLHTRPVSRITYEMTAARDDITAAAGSPVPVTWFRSPGGDWSPTVRGVAAGYGMRSLGWSVDSRDWERKGVDQILATIQAEVKPGAVILMHDGGGDRSQTVEALRQLLPWLVSQGYAFSFPAS